MRTIEEIDREIDQLKRELAEVKGRETEVYSRIVGYYRSVKNWNKGKKQEFSERVLYNPTFERIEEQIARASLSPADDRSVSCSQEEEEVHSSLKHPSSYLFFFRPTCPNCPPVKRVLAGLPLEGRMINVDTEHGITEAR
ncbi:MAG TPA: anaerobic ribonucleoside-triphosphate reductase, partial [Spirochaetia bacterium]|nr:anaerobic ribonucleoside-triphosphate reductase [Spirochaetia bacterium]